MVNQTSNFKRVEGGFRSVLGGSRTFQGASGALRTSGSSQGGFESVSGGNQKYSLNCLRVKVRILWSFGTFHGMAWGLQCLKGYQKISGIPINSSSVSASFRGSGGPEGF